MASHIDMSLDTKLGLAPNLSTVEKWPNLYGPTLSLVSLANYQRKYAYLLSKLIGHLKSLIVEQASQTFDGFPRRHVSRR